MRVGFFEHVDKQVSIDSEILCYDRYVRFAICGNEEVYKIFRTERIAGHLLYNMCFSGVQLIDIGWEAL